MFPNDADVKAVQDAMFDPFEYFVLRNRDGLLKKDFTQRSARSRITSPAIRACRTSGRRRARCSRWCPGRRSRPSSAAPGHDGTWGVKNRVLRELDEDRPAGVPPDGGRGADWISSDCPIAARHIRQGMGAQAPEAKKAHPLSLLRKAYGR
jgi:hypothetical protein